MDYSCDRKGDRILALYQLQAKGFFMQAGLPPMVLAQVLFRVEVCLVSPGCSQIWGVADMNGDGKMDIHEFSIACKLINLKLKGMELPKVPKKTSKLLNFSPLLLSLYLCKCLGKLLRPTCQG